MDRNRRHRPLARFAARATLLVWLGLVPVVATALGDSGADGDFDRRDSFHFTLFQDVDLDESGGLRGSRNFEQAVLRELEAAFDRLDAILALRPEKKILVYVWDETVFEQRFAGLFRFPAAGFYGGAIHVRTGDRVSPALVRTLHHELVHAAFDLEAPRLVLPAWMNEGIAEWFEARASGKRTLSGGERQALRRAARQGTLFSLSELGARSFSDFGPDAARLAYLESYAFIDHLVRSHGERGLVRFWRAVVRSRSLDRGSRRAYRQDLETLERGFRRSIGAS
ncbi:MAG TPA: hypothetical protein ENI85_17235 [Deltaproteobacteria bacterium]|nr:hypothetical protein [Deltaproteobacteria bacterium]